MCVKQSQFCITTAWTSMSFSKSEIPIERPFSKGSDEHLQPQKYSTGVYPYSIVSSGTIDFSNHPARLSCQIFGEFLQCNHEDPKSGQPDDIHFHARSRSSAGGKQAVRCSWRAARRYPQGLISCGRQKTWRGRRLDRMVRISIT